VNPAECSFDAQLYFSTDEEFEAYSSGHPSAETNAAVEG
jgi:hypothetical protein